MGANRTNIATIAETWKDDLHRFLFDKRKRALTVKSGNKVVSSHTCYFDKMAGVVKYYGKKKKIRTGERDWIIKELDLFKKDFDKIVLADDEAQKSYIKEFEKRKKGQRAYVANLYCRLMIVLYETTGGIAEYAIESWFARMGLSWKDRYVLTATVRADGSSRFAPAHRWGARPM